MLHDRAANAAPQPAEIGRAPHKQGWLSSDTAEPVFQECRVPARHMLRDENRGFYAVMRNFQNERIVLGTQAMGEAAKRLPRRRAGWPRRAAQPIVLRANAWM